MSFEILLIVWCATSLLVGGGLVLWAVVEMKIFADWWMARRARKLRYVWPSARWIRRSKQRNGSAAAPSSARCQVADSRDSTPVRKIHF